MSYTGSDFIEQMIESTGANVSVLAQNALTSRSQQMIDAGLDSNQALAFVLMANVGFRNSVDGLQDMLTQIRNVKQELSPDDGDDDDDDDDDVIGDDDDDVIGDDDDDRQFDTVIDVENDETYDAADLGDVRFNFEISEGDVEFAIIQNFSAGDAISIADWDGTGVFDRAGIDQLVFAVGDVENFQGAWVVTFTGVDADLVNDVVALGGQFDAQIALLADANAWGDWLI